MTILAETCSKPTPFIGFPEAQTMAEYRAGGDRDDVVSHDPLAALESTLIEAYLRARGYTGQSLQAMPKKAARQLMAEASAYASARLAELEARARLVQELEGKADNLRFRPFGMPSIFQSGTPTAGLANLLDLLLGGTIANFRVLAMGVYPYITASITLQMLP